MTLLAALFAVGLGGFVIVIFVTTADSVEESDYQRVIEMKDALADVLPPPLYVLESWSVAQEMADSAADKPHVAQLSDAWRALEKDARTRREYWVQHLTVVEARPLLGEVEQTADRFFSIGDTQLIPAIQSDDTLKSAGAKAALVDAYHLQRAAVDRFVAFTNQQTVREVTQAASNIRRRKLLSAFFGTLLALVAGGVGLLIARDLARRMRESVTLLRHVANGDLTVRMDTSISDEIGDMAEALNAAFESVHDALTSVQQASIELSAAASELAASSDQISGGAQKQAASLEETAASLEEISSTVRQNADNAQHAAQLANGAREAAERGGQVVESAVAAMTAITGSSKHIADIITTIDEIAFQTNLLALNAAVEAARAGEQGRGFSVVASEVRTLAQRTAAAAKEIRSLIADSSAKVETGTEQVNESGQTLGEIVRSVKRVTDMVAEIAAASQEQNTGVDQVNTAVTQVDQVTQSNAAQTEELAATATALSEKSAELQQLVAAFTLSGGGTVPRQRSAATRSPRYAPPPLPAEKVPLRRARPSPIARRANGSPPKADGGYEEF